MVRSIHIGIHMTLLIKRTIWSLSNYLAVQRSLCNAQPALSHLHSAASH